MKQEQADTLIKKLGMARELEILLDSPEAYGRFEMGVEEAICQGENRLNITLFEEEKSSGRKVPREITRGNYRRSAEMFRQYFGIGEEPKTLKSIAPQYDVTRSFVGQSVNLLAEFLRQRYRKDIWYSTL